MDELLEELQRRIYTLVCEIDDICRKHNIRYYLHGGSVIGAMRHRGIIPWDDDIDVVMTRNEWERFKKAFAESKVANRELVTPEDYPEWILTYPQYKDTSTTIFYKSGLFTKFPLGIFVDIIILDPALNSEKYLENHSTKLKDLSELCNRNYIINRASSYSNFKFYNFLYKIVGEQKVKAHLLDGITKVSEEECDGYIQRAGVYPVFWDKKFFMEPEYVTFGDRKLPVPSNTLEYLRYTYGDSWMCYPDAIGRERHGFLFLPNVNNVQCQKLYEKYIDEKKYKKAFKKFKSLRFQAVNYEEEVRKYNRLRAAEAYGLAVVEQIKNADFEELFNHDRYSEMEEFLKFYYRHQLDSYFTKDKIGIPIDKKALYYACLLLILKGQYYNATKVLGCYNKNYLKKEHMEELEALIEKTRELSIACYEEQFDEKKIARLAKNALADYSHHVDFIAAKCGSMMRSYKNKGSRNRIGKVKYLKLVECLCRDELQIHPEAWWLKKYLADIALIHGNKSEAVALLTEVVNNTNDGILRLYALDTAAQHSLQLDVIDIDTRLSEEDNEEYNKLVRESQAKLLELIKDLSEICDNNNIPYFVGGYMAAEAVELKTFAPECMSGYIVLHPNDRERFIEAVNNSGKKDRLLESFENNKNYADFSMQYCDVSSVMFDLKEESFCNCHAINVQILFVRPYVWNDKKRFIMDCINGAVEAIALPSVFHNISDKKELLGVAGKIASFVLGKSNFKKLAWHILYKLKRTDYNIKGGIKTYWAKEIVLPQLDFRKTAFCYLDGVKLRIPVNYKAFNARQIKGNWNNGEPVGKLLKGDIIAVANVSSEEFSNKLNKLNITNKFYSKWSKLAKINVECIKKSGYALNYSWNIAMFTYDKILLSRKYIPLKNEIRELYFKKNFTKLREILDEYIKKIIYYSEQGMPLVLDEELSIIVWAVMANAGKSYHIKKVFHKVEVDTFRKITTL